MIAEGLQGFMTIDKTNTDDEENEPRIAVSIQTHIGRGQ